MINGDTRRERLEFQSMFPKQTFTVGLNRRKNLGQEKRYHNYYIVPVTGVFW
jgi:hypothetical protein